MNAWRPERRTLVLAVGTALTCLSLALALTDSLRQLELDTVDARFEIRGRQAPPADVVDVHIDDVTFDELGVRWPFPRGMHARVIDELRRAGAKVIAYDVQFTEASGSSQAAIRQDYALFDAVTRARGKVVLATSEVDDAGGTLVLGGDENVRAAGARVGNALLPSDSDGVIRRFPAALEGLTGFAVAAVEVANGSRVPADRFSDGSAWIDFHGPPDSVRSLSFFRVLRGRFDPDLVRDKIVVVGPYAPTLQDIHPTSTSAAEQMSGPEIHASAIATLLSERRLGELPGWATALLVVLLGMVPTLAVLLFERLGLAIAAAVGLGYLVASQLAFEAGTILPVIYPLIALVTSGIGIVVVDYSAATYERLHSREVLARFLPESLVDETLRCRDEDLRLMWKKVQATAVVCDLRRFTTFAENRPAEQVNEALNEFLGEITDAIHAHGGTLIQYRGDGVLAVFGAPMKADDHPDRALDAVREIVGSRMERFNASRRAAEQDEFRIGVGVDSGMIVCGLMGAPSRLDYNAVGDAVNMAARLEDETKRTPHEVLVSGTTRAFLTRAAPDLSYVGPFPVRGREASANVFTLGSRRDRIDISREPATVESAPDG